MSIDRISKFYEAAMAQKKFSPEFFNELREISNETELKAFIEKEVQPIAKSMDYNFSTEDFLNYEEEITQNLTEQQLENVGGGVNVKIFPEEMIRELQLEAKVMVFQGIVKIHFYRI